MIVFLEGAQKSYCYETTSWSIMLRSPRRPTCSRYNPRTTKSASYSVAVVTSYARASSDRRLDHGDQLLGSIAF
uniref:Uncharacterized protein n=1 Tax=Arundo donax TaxID=35708 RepID=A0A0A9FJ66_ARUDO